MIPTRQLVGQRQRGLQRKRKILMATAAVLLWVLGMVAGVSVYLKTRGQKSLPVRLIERVASWVVPPDYAFAGRDRLNILVVGADYDYDNKARPLPRPARSDTIMVVSLSRDGEVAILSIPRDTVVRFNGKLRKINAAHAVGGPELLQRVLADQFGIITHHFVQITFDAFVKLVDLVGGVDLFVEYDMHYDDNWGKLHIHLQRGWHHLNGEQAMGFVRYRGKGYKRFCPKCKVKIERWDPRGDLGRVERQQQFLKELAKKLLQPNMITKLPQLASIAYQHVATDMDLRTLLSLANFARQLNLEAFKTATLPGTGAYHPRLGSILIPDREKVPKVLSSILGPTFLVSAWEQGGGTIGSAVRLTARAERRAPLRHPTRPATEHEEELPEVETMEGIPLNHEPTEAIIVEPLPMPSSPPPEVPEPPTEQPSPEPPSETAPAPQGQPSSSSTPSTGNPAGTSGP